MTRRLKSSVFSCVGSRPAIVSSTPARSNVVRTPHEGEPPTPTPPVRIGRTGRSHECRGRPGPRDGGRPNACRAGTARWPGGVAGEASCGRRRKQAWCTASPRHPRRAAPGKASGRCPPRRVAALPPPRRSLRARGAAPVAHVLVQHAVRHEHDLPERASLRTRRRTSGFISIAAFGRSGWEPGSPQSTGQMTSVRQVAGSVDWSLR